MKQRQDAEWYEWTHAFAMNHKKAPTGCRGFFIVSIISLTFYNAPATYVHLSVFKDVFLITLGFVRYDLHEMQNLTSSLHSETQLY